MRAHARRLRRAWEAGMGGGDAGALRGVIEQSWSRMAGAGIDPEHLHPRSAFEPAALGDVRAASPLNDVLPVLRRCLGSLAHDAEHVMVVCDAAGNVLWIEGHPRVKRTAERITFMEGMLWTEDSAGTNAIGTALAIDHAVQIFSAEHFLPEQHPWWCSAAPIHDPATAELLGVVDLSGPLRTAHPHSLALVIAAAGMAEDVLRFKHAAEDERLRQLYVEHTSRAGGASAVVGRDGRVLMARPRGWIAGRLAIPPDGGPLTLPDGREAVAERLDRGHGWVLREPSDRALLHAPPPVELRLSLLGRRPDVRRAAAEPLELSLRHAEVLALLAIQPEGLTADQLTQQLYGERGNRVSTRAEMSRLRKLLGPCLAAKPYRLVARVTADFLEVEHLLAAGEVGLALERYRVPLLADSDAPRIERARDELEAALRRAALAGEPRHLWSWLQSEPGRDDAVALAEYVRRVRGDDPCRPVAAARLRSLQIRWRDESPALSGVR